LKNLILYYISKFDINLKKIHIVDDVYLKGVISQLRILYDFDSYTYVGGHRPSKLERFIE
jgi:hypothetical protein